MAYRQVPRMKWTGCIDLVPLMLTYMINIVWMHQLRICLIQSPETYHLETYLPTVSPCGLFPFPLTSQQAYTLIGSMHLRMHFFLSSRLTKAAAVAILTVSCRDRFSGASASWTVSLRSPCQWRLSISIYNFVIVSFCRCYCVYCRWLGVAHDGGVKMYLRSRHLRYPLSLLSFLSF